MISVCSVKIFISLSHEHTNAQRTLFSTDASLRKSSFTFYIYSDIYTSLFTITGSK